jgi:hypothetical protein
LTLILLFLVEFTRSRPILAAKLYFNFPLTRDKKMLLITKNLLLIRFAFFIFLTTKFVYFDFIGFIVFIIEVIIIAITFLTSEIHLTLNKQTIFQEKLIFHETFEKRNLIIFLSLYLTKNLK